MQIGLNGTALVGKASVEVAEADDRLVRMFIASPADGIEDADRGQERDGLARGGEQLLDGLRVHARLAEDPVVEHGQLVRANDQRIARVGRVAA